MKSRYTINEKLRNGYTVRIRIALLSSLIFLILLTKAFPRFKTSSLKEIGGVSVVINQFEIPPTQQNEIPPRPSRPAIPIESENDELAEDVTIEETDLDNFTEWESPPPPSDKGPKAKFIAYDEPPVPIGGIAGIMRNVIYPDIAIIAGIQGTVLVRVFVQADGKVSEATVVDGLDGTGLNEAAIEALKKTKFKPAKQRDVPIGVYISIPVRFSFKDFIQS